MQRTYRSIKDTGGGVDPREVLLSMDERSSAFDAFYIQNIKQTKRELSSMGAGNQSNYSASNRVRKRKTVKRIVKNVESSIRESISTNLTPDKSIHVNRGPDLFDQLLNEASPVQFRPEISKTDSPFDKLLLSVQKNNKGSRKVSRKKKKLYNCSSSDCSDAEKENEDRISASHNATDIRKHELIIENKYQEKSLLQDESINQIVNNLSLIKNIIQINGSDELMSKSPIKNNRLTKNFLTPSKENSPLCSTPFAEKYRSKSIYNFSPISTRNVEECSDTKKNNNESVVLLPKELKNELSEMLKSDMKQSPILSCSSKGSFNSNSSSQSNIAIKKKNSKNSSEEKLEKIESQLPENCRNFTNVEPNSNSDPVTFCDKSSKNNDEIGFLTVPSPRKSVVLKCKFINRTRKKRSFGYSKNKSLRDSTSVAKKNDRSHLSPVIAYLEDNTKAYQYNSAMGVTMLQCEEFKPVHEIKSDINKEVTKSNTVIVNSKDLFESSKDTSEVDASLHTDNEVESLYNTCSSQNSCSEEDAVKIPKTSPRKLIILLDKMNDSTFFKYYKKLDTLENSSISDKSDTCHENVNNTANNEVSNTSDGVNYISDNNTSLGSNGPNNMTIADRSVLNPDESHLIPSSDSIEDGTDAHSNDDEKKCFSFVTTRRKNDTANYSIMMFLNDSYDSVSSSECNKTVLSNRISNVADPKNVESQLDSLKNIKENELPVPVGTELSRLQEFDKEIILKEMNKQSSRRKTCKDTNLKTSKPDFIHINKTQESRLSFNGDPSLDNTNIKQPIVLQPGKKWERSLSIYKRLTVANEFDYSIFEDDGCNKKGRKYRESIIHTMELQDHIGPLHNDSFSSCRSSIVSKPHRSTIRIVKEPSSSRVSLRTTEVYDDLTGFLHEDCDDTVVELSKLSISDIGHEVTIVGKIHDSSQRLTSAQDYVLRRCNQTEPVLFDECYPDTVLKNCHKIGEGVYGEVFLWRARDGRARVMKVVPVAGTVKVNGEQQKDYHEIISEIVIAMELSALRAPIADIESHLDEGKDVEALDLHSIENATDCFNEVLAVRCVYGNYPSRLLDLWDLYDECKGSENDNPAILPSDQHYIVLELANAGQDLESYQFNNAEQAYALFLQVAFGLAVGEEAFQFEHRDLHWGNVLIAPTEQKYATYVVRGRLHRVLRRGVRGTIIDYSLSRLSLQLGGGQQAALYNELGTDEALFEARGDYQFEVYRLMRDKLGNEWKNFEPYTNILWLHYTLDKMITALRYKRVNTKLHKHYIGKLKEIKNRILDYGSAVQFVLTDNEF